MRGDWPPRGVVSLNKRKNGFNRDLVLVGLSTDSANTKQAFLAGFVGLGAAKGYL